MIFSCILAAALAFSQEDAEGALHLADEFITKHPVRDAGTSEGIRAANWVFDHASVAAGRAERDFFYADTPKGRRTFVNVYATIARDPTRPWTVLVSHFDTKPGIGCPGANDGASTTALLLKLADVISRERDFPCNVFFVFTDAEECMEAFYSEKDGFQGSKRAAEVLKKRELNVRAVVCFDMLGDRDLKVMIPANGSATLAKIALVAAKRAKLPRGKVARSTLQVKDDHVAFLDAGFPAIDLIDFDYGEKPGVNDYWHSPDDTIDKLSAASLRSAGALAAELTSVLAVPAK